MPGGDWFCRGECAELWKALRAQCTAVPQHLRRSLQLPAGCKHPAGEYTWQWLRGADGSAPTKRALQTALELLEECFTPITDGDGAELKGGLGDAGQREEWMPAAARFGSQGI